MTRKFVSLSLLGLSLVQFTYGTAFAGTAPSQESVSNTLRALSGMGFVLEESLILAQNCKLEYDSCSSSSDCCDSMTCKKVGAYSGNVCVDD